MKESDRKAILNLFLEELKKNKKLPTIKKLEEIKVGISSLFSQVLKDETIKKEIIEIITENYKDRIQHNKTKMGSIVSRLYLENKESFDRFFFLNLTDQQKTEEFQTVGKIVLKSIQQGEEEHVGRMESGKYRDFSTSVNEKYIEYIRSFFPYYGFVGVTIRNSI